MDADTDTQSVDGVALPDADAEVVIVVEGVKVMVADAVEVEDEEVVGGTVGDADADKEVEVEGDRVVVPEEVKEEDVPARTATRAQPDSHTCNSICNLHGNGAHTAPRSDPA